MQNPAQAPAAPQDDRFTRKARVLLDLFGPSGVERLKQAGLPADLLPETVAQDDNASDDDGREALLQRLRDRGLLTSNPSRTPKPASEPETSALSARIADNLDGSALEAEHPAVIAHVLQSQPRAVRLRVLRALPGTVARAVMPFLKSGGSAP